MEDSHPEDTMEQQDSPKEKRPSSPGGNICEYCWPEEGGPRSLCIPCYGATGPCLLGRGWNDLELAYQELPLLSLCSGVLIMFWPHTRKGMQSRRIGWLPREVWVRNVARNLRCEESPKVLAAALI